MNFIYSIVIDFFIIRGYFVIDLFINMYINPIYFPEMNLVYFNL